MSDTADASDIEQRVDHDRSTEERRKCFIIKVFESDTKFSGKK